MTYFHQLLLIVLTVAIAQPGHGAAPWESYPWSAAIEGEVEEPAPVRVTLPKEWLRKAGAEQASLRVRDDRGREVPRVIAVQSGQEQGRGPGEGSMASIGEIPAEWDRWPLEVPNRKRDDSGRSIYELGVLRIPLDRVEIETSDPFFARRAWIEAGSSDEDGFRTKMSGDFRRQPGTRAPSLHLAGTIPYAEESRLVIDDGENPPLNLEEIVLAWHRRELVFIAIPGRTYTVFAGAEDADQPRYDLDRVLGTQPADLAGMTVFRAGPPAENPEWNPAWGDPDFWTTDRRQLVYSVLVVVLACGLGFWIWRLLRAGER